MTLTIRSFAICTIVLGMFPACCQAGFISTASVSTTNAGTESDNGAVATASIQNSVASSSGSASSRVGESYSGLMKQFVVASDDDNNRFTSWRSRAIGSFSDQVIWNGSTPAPNTVFLTVTYDGIFSGAPLGTHTSVRGQASSIVNVTQNGFIDKGSMFASLELSRDGSVTLGTDGTSFIDTSFLQPRKFIGTRRFELLKDSASDSYNFQISLDTSVFVNDVSMLADIGSTLSLGDISLNDGTSVIDQVTLGSGLTPQLGSPVPEPTSLALYLVAIGCGGVARFRCRRG